MTGAVATSELVRKQPHERVRSPDWSCVRRGGSGEISGSRHLQGAVSHGPAPGCGQLGALQRGAQTGGAAACLLSANGSLRRVRPLPPFHPQLPLLANSQPEPQSTGASGKHSSQPPRAGRGVHCHGTECPRTSRTPVFSGKPRSSSDRPLVSPRPPFS